MRCVYTATNHALTVRPRLKRYSSLTLWMIHLCVCSPAMSCILCTHNRHLSHEVTIELWTVGHQFLCQHQTNSAKRCQPNGREAWKQMHLSCTLLSKAFNLIEINKCIQDARLKLIFEPICWSKRGIYQLKLNVASATSEGRVRDGKQDVKRNDVMMWIPVKFIEQFYNNSRNHQSSFTLYFRSYSVQ